MAKVKALHRSWEKIFQEYHIDKHNFSSNPFYITSKQIGKACQDFKRPSEKEARILCKQDCREDRPHIFIEKGLFILPVKNGEYAIIEGEGYLDIPSIKKTETIYKSKLDFILDTSLVGNSEMQHLHFAYASSLIRTFMEDKSLVLSIAGRKYTPKFSFKVGNKNIEVQSVQTEIDAGYEGKKQVVLIEAKNFKTTNTIIRQLYYPFRRWQTYTDKKVIILFFEKNNDIYSIWEFQFIDVKDYNSVELIRSSKFKIKN